MGMSVDTNRRLLPRQEFSPLAGESPPFIQPVIEGHPMPPQFEHLLHRKPARLESIHVAGYGRHRSYLCQQFDDATLADIAGVKDMVDPGKVME